MTSGKPRAWVASAGLAISLLCGLAVADEPPKYVPGQGFDVARGELGSLNISAYVLLRYLNQLPAEQSFTDHLGRNRTIDTRNDIQLHRIMIHFAGFLFTP